MTWLALEKVFLWFLLYSFVGWLWENVLKIVMKKRFVDRGPRLQNMSAAGMR